MTRAIIFFIALVLVSCQSPAVPLPIPTPVPTNTAAPTQPVPTAGSRATPSPSKIPDLGAWMSGPALSVSRGEVAAAVAGNQIYVVGGFGGTKAVRSEEHTSELQ